MSSISFVLPQKQFVHLPDGQFPPQLSDRTRVVRRKSVSRIFIQLYICMGVLLVRFYFFGVLDQQPQDVCVDQGFQLFPDPWYTLIAQFKFWVGSQGAWPPLQPPQLILLICHKPTSVDPLVLQFIALAFPPLSCETIHLQQATFQLCFPHQVAMSSIFFVFPQQHVWHFPDGQFPPQLSARARARIIVRTRTSFICNEININ